MSYPTVILATTNKDKVADYTAIWDHYRKEYFFSLKKVPYKLDDPEEGDFSTSENALLKARHYAKTLSRPVLSDDSGISVDGLGGAPGLLAHRWSNEKGMTLGDAILSELPAGVTRKAHIFTSLAFADPLTGEAHVVEAVQHGTIGLVNTAPSTHGGYRGVFIPDGYTQPLWDIGIDHLIKSHTYFRKTAYRRLMEIVYPLISAL